MPVLDNLFVKLGYDVDQEKIDKFNTGVAATAIGMRRIAIGGIAAATAIGAFVGKMAQFANSRKQVAEGLNISTDSLQAWKDFADDIGVGSDVAVSALARVVEMQENLAGGKPPGPEVQRGLAKLGISMGDIAKLSPEEVLLKMNGALLKLDKKTQGVSLRMAGFRNEINLLANKGLAKGISENFNSIDTSNLEKITTDWANMTQSIRDASLEFAGEIAPTISDGMKLITGTIEDLRKNFGGFLKAIINDEINPIDDAIRKVDKSLFDLSRGFTTDIFESIGLNKFTDFLKELTSGGAFSSGATRFLAGAPTGAQAGAGARGGDTLINNNEFNFKLLGTDPNAMARAVKREFNRQTEKATGDFKSSRKN